MPTTATPPHALETSPAPRRISWWDSLALVVLGLAGGALSYDALRQTAVAIHVRPALTYLFPLVIDGFIAYGVRALLVLRNAPLPLPPLRLDPLRHRHHRKRLGQRPPRHPPQPANPHHRPTPRRHHRRHPLHHRPTRSRRSRPPPHPHHPHQHLVAHARHPRRHRRGPAEPAPDTRPPGARHPAHPPGTPGRRPENRTSRTGPPHRPPTQRGTRRTPQPGPPGPPPARNPDPSPGPRTRPRRRPHRQRGPPHPAHDRTTRGPRPDLTESLPSSTGGPAPPGPPNRTTPKPNRSTPRNPADQNSQTSRSRPSTAPRSLCRHPGRSPGEQRPWHASERTIPPHHQLDRQRPNPLFGPLPGSE